MKKILFISNEGSLTGAPIFLVKLVRQLKERTNYQILVLFSKPGHLTATLEREGFDVVTSVKSAKYISILQKVLKRITHYLRYAKLLFSYRPDLIYSNTVVNSGEVVLAGLLRIPVILHMHEGQHVANQFRFRLICSCFFADKIIVGSQYVNNVLFEITKRHGQVIYNGVIPPNNTCNEKVKSHKPALLGIIGTINANKGQHVAIEAIRILVEKGIGVRLFVAGVSGDTTYFDKIKNYVNQSSLDDFVKFVGAVPNAESFIRELDVLLVPSFDEALPTVILEAFSAGTPVVASNVGGISEMIENGVSGFLFQAGDSGVLAGCLERIIYNKELLDNITTSAYALVRVKFDVDTTNNKIETCINKILLK